MKVVIQIDTLGISIHFIKTSYHKINKGIANPLIKSSPQTIKKNRKAAIKVIYVNGKSRKEVNRKGN